MVSSKLIRTLKEALLIYLTLHYYAEIQIKTSPLLGEAAINPYTELFQILKIFSKNYFNIVI